MIAQTTMPSLWQKLWEVPSLDSLARYLQQSGPVPMVITLALGLAVLLLGWRFFKLVVLINATVIGALIGAELGARIPGENTYLLGTIGGGLLLAALAVPLMKYAVSFMGALAGWCLGVAVWQYAATLLERQGDLGGYAWTGGLIGTITLALLAFVIFKLVVMVFTSFQGATMAMAALLALLLRFEPTEATIETWLRNPHVPPLLVTIPAVIGFACQYNCDKATKKKE
ncbi:MAG: hypothetical protein BWX88_05163 [Planctomycetes bacterium ADurb.Bin126]|nr:MAG: hypothetical protein BWX88_05163 [Planctomycetes bacterium ADurb.Bin126]HOD83819.1 DUF4203 domain-containing protein [Phycisphaerae bacterium]HQL74304.1 DUF4203 domain-containing protein [Phycisphaerae bacterium]